MILYISVASVVTSFSFLIYLFEPSLFFFLGSLAHGLSVLFIFSKNQLLVSLIISIVSFSLYFTYFCSDLYDFFPSTDLGFVCSFSNSFRYNVRLFIWTGSKGWLWGPRGPRASAGPLVGGAGSWALWWVGLGPSAAGVLEGPMACDLPVDGAVSLPSSLLGLGCPRTGASWLVGGAAAWH